MKVQIRAEEPRDRDQIDHVIRQAFSSSDFGHHGEAELVVSLRESDSQVLSLVACHERSDVIGHIMFSPVRLETAQESFSGVGLAPMSVLPDRQRQGIGSALVSEGLRQLFESDIPFIVVLGHPDYYQKFGFRPAKELGVMHGFSGIPQDVFFIQVNPAFDENQLSGGTTVFQPAFGPQQSR